MEDGLDCLEGIDFGLGVVVADMEAGLIVFDVFDVPLAGMEVL